MTDPIRPEGRKPRVDRFGDSAPGSIRYEPPDEAEGDGPAEAEAKGGADPGPAIRPGRFYTTEPGLIEYTPPEGPEAEGDDDDEPEKDQP